MCYLYRNNTDRVICSIFGVWLLAYVHDTIYTIWGVIAVHEWNRYNVWPSTWIKDNIWWFFLRKRNFENALLIQSWKIDKQDIDIVNKKGGRKGDGYTSVVDYFEMFIKSKVSLLNPKFYKPPDCQNINQLIYVE